MEEGEWGERGGVEGRKTAEQGLREEGGVRGGELRRGKLERREGREGGGSVRARGEEVGEESGWSRRVGGQGGGGWEDEGRGGERGAMGGGYESVEVVGEGTGVTRGEGEIPFLGV